LSRIGGADDKHGGAVLHDSHAEVLARRGLMSVLWQEIESKLEEEYDVQKNGSGGGIKKLESDEGPLFGESFSTNKDLLVVDRSFADSGRPSVPIRFRLRPDISLHLYVSDSPCGDASIYELGASDCLEKKDIGRSSDGSPSEETSIPKKFTGAKIVLSSATGITTENPNITNKINDATPVEASTGGTSNLHHIGASDASNTAHGLSSEFSLAREDDQILAALRTKSGRSNIPAHLRSASMSCSDKLCRWTLLGVQGGLLSSWIPSPIFFRSICVARDPRVADLGNDPQLEALRRAVVDRGKKAHRAVAADDEIKKSAFALHCETSVLIVDHIFPQGMSTSKETTEHERSNGYRNLTGCKDSSKSKHVLSACGLSLNWQQKSPSFEVTVGGKGHREGKIRPKDDFATSKVFSRLCRRMFNLHAQRCELVHDRIQKEQPPSRSRRRNAWCSTSLGSSQKMLLYSKLKQDMSTGDYWRMRGLILVGLEYLHGNNSCQRCASPVTKMDGPLVGWVLKPKVGDFIVCQERNSLKRLQEEALGAKGDRVAARTRTEETQKEP